MQRFAVCMCLRRMGIGKRFRNYGFFVGEDVRRGGLRVMDEKEVLSGAEVCCVYVFKGRGLEIRVFFWAEMCGAEG